jgi:hypothetical protein
MTEIKFNGRTYVGTAEGDHGVFTNSKGTVYAGKIADGCACVGVATYTDGRTSFAECDADGKSHGRDLECDAGGYTKYRRCEHGSVKEDAVLYYTGTCTYNGRPCFANYAPFVALRAQGLAIKARPPLVHPQPPLCRIFSPPPPPNRSNRPLFWNSQELATTHANKVRARDSAISLRGPCGTATAKQMHLASNLDDAPAEGCSTRAPQPHA